jgi:uncharacterized protein with ATP-grasp and redox domains
LNDRVLPPPITAAEPGSYARYSVSVRLPRIIEQVIESNPVEASAREALRELAREIRDGVVTSPFPGGHVPPSSMDGEERRTWETQIAAQEGRKWLDIPWYFAEAFYYLKLLAAFGYFQAAAHGDPRAADPFRPQKERELFDPDGGLAMARRIMAAAAGMSSEEALPLLLHSSLWGNRLDLSTFEVDESRRKSVFNRDGESLLVDHTGSAASALRSAGCVQVLLDNAGPELVCDLLLVDCLLSRPDHAGPPRIVLHAKKAPFFVSDATMRDTVQTVQAMASDTDALVAGAGQRLSDALAAARLTVCDHWFWSSALAFTAFPDNLKHDLAAADVLLVKGDANYRRTLEDRKWESSASLDELAGYFPAPFIALRTMKSELVVDVPKEAADRLSRLDPQWMINGKRGLIRFCRAGAGKAA